MKRKAGFTLVELLAVIVVLGIIMVIATGTVTNVIKNARKNAYINSHEMLVKEIKTRIQKNKLGFDQEIVCNDSVPTEKCSAIYDISEEDFEMIVEKDDNGNYIFSLMGEGTFSDVSTADIIDKLPTGTIKTDERNSVDLAFDSNGNEIVDTKQIVENNEKVKESREASFAYFDLLTEAAKIIRESLEAGNQLVNEYKINDNVVARTDMGRCNGAKISIRFNMPQPGIDESAEALDSFDFNAKPALFDKISIENYKKVDLKYLPEYKSMPGNENIHLPYRRYSYGTTIRKWVAYCYTDYTYEVTQSATKDYINFEDPDDIFKSYRTIDLENKVLKDLQ